MLAITAIIPTKNRPTDLQNVVRSLIAQGIQPASLLIVDQSESDEGRRLIERLFVTTETPKTKINLEYVHDPRINGLAMARNRAMEIAPGDVWLFLDDDVVLEPQFIGELLSVYDGHPDAVGVSGIITNYPYPDPGFRIWSAIFMRGPFHDERQPIYWRANQLRDCPPIRVRRFGGGLMSFRAQAIRGKSFDKSLHGVSDGEDVDFCAQLGSDVKLLIAPGARLAHYHSSAERLQDHWLRRMVRGNVFLYRKHWNHGLSNRLFYAWLIIGCSFVATLASTRRFSLAPFRALLTGFNEARQVSVGR